MKEHMVRTVSVQPKVKRENIKITRDTARVLARPLVLQGPADRIERTIERITRLSNDESQQMKQTIHREFSRRHKNLEEICDRHFSLVSKYIPKKEKISDVTKFLIGAFFTMEYSIESAALFNPSMVPSPDQSGAPKDGLRFIMSLRATGEGHISSIVFRTGTISPEHKISLDPVSHYTEMPEIHSLEGGKHGADDANYSLHFHSSQQITERTIFPVLKIESKGIEDARFVRFVTESGDAVYYATYTAYDGFSILPQLIETKDYLTFNVITLRGKAVVNKGMALFPRKINGKFVMLSRQDGENNRIMTSDDLYRWEKTKIIQEPARPWEFIQLGNCGSPIETREGWLVLTHGVGAMRKYSIGAILLDLQHPEKVIAHLEEPLLSPNEKEREGYVPNVVYSCGSLIHNNKLIIPYAMSDISSGIATVGVDELIAGMKSL